jgi:transcription elongation GreA/GreB family factor
MNKEALRHAICDQLRAQLALQTGAAALARDEAISEESRPESKYDTHSQEAAYLAEGQARMAGGIETDIARCLALKLPAGGDGSPAAMGSVLELERNGRSSWYFLAPAAGGLEVEHGGQKVLVLTPQSPLGRTLLGKRAGELVPLPPKGSGRIARII